MRLILKLAVSATLVAVLLFGLGAAGEIGVVLAAAAPAYVGLALAAFALDRVLMTYKWLLLLASRGLRLPLWRGVQIYCASMVWGLFLPATVGADAIRGYMTVREGVDGYEVFASITVERLVGFLASLLFGLAGFLILSTTGVADERLDAAWRTGAFVTLAAALTLAASFNERVFDAVLALLPRRLRESRIVQRLRHFHGAYRGYGRSRTTLGAFFALTLVEQCLVVAATWVTALALAIDVSLLLMAGAVPLSMLVSRLPISIDGIGVYESVMVMTMALAGVAAAEAVALALAYRGLQVLFWLPWWLAYTVRTGSIRPPRAAPAP